MIKAFPKIFAIGTDYISDIFKEPVEITEKIDGSQFVFGKINGELFMRSKGAQLYADNPEKMFSLAIDYVVSIEHMIPDNKVFYCEYLKSPKHNTMAYERTPTNHLLLFGVCDETGTRWENYDGIHHHADCLGLELIPIIKRGPIGTPEELLGLLQRRSILGGTAIEGIVVKNYERKFLLGGQPMPLMAGKFVSEKFKEVHGARWNKEEKSKGRFACFCERFKTEARWEKAIQHLRDSGEIENTPRDIGKLLKEINQDIESEEKENIKEWLWKENKGNILRTATKGFPEWYKEQLLGRSFEK